MSKGGRRRGKGRRVDRKSKGRRKSEGGKIRSKWRRMTESKTGG